jgi:hypothetical protein
MAQFELGISDSHLGLYQDAVEHLETACRVAPRAEQCRWELEEIQEQAAGQAAQEHAP